MNIRKQGGGEISFCEAGEQVSAARREKSVSITPPDRQGGTRAVGATSGRSSYKLNDTEACSSLHVQLIL